MPRPHLKPACNLLYQNMDEQGCIPRDLRRSILITISDFYDNRSDIVFSKPYSIGRAAALSAPFIKFRGAEEDGTT